MALRHALKDVRTINDLLTSAEREALAMGDEQPGAEHLVLAALMLEDDSARMALGRTPGQFRDAIAAVHAAALQRIGIELGPSRTGEGSTPPPAATGVYRSTGSAQDLFQRTRVLAAKSQLRTAHVLLAALELTPGTTARVFEHLEIDREAVAEAARQQLDAR